MGVAQKDILNGWKEIAGYVARDIRTVERWEKQRGLPVRRVPGAGRATVYARISELEEWLASKPLEGDTAGFAVAPTPLEVVPVQPSSVAGHAVEAPFAHTPTQIIPEPAARRHTLTYSAAAAVILLVGLSFFALWHSHVSAEAAHAASKPPSRLLSAPHSTVPGVEESYLRGSYLYEQRTPETLSKAIDSFNSAIQRDPNYAPAYAGLANTYNLLREYSVMPDSAAYPKAQAAAERAVALDPTLAQAHVSLGFVAYYWYMDAGKAEREFRTAISLDPTLAQAHHWYGSVLTHEGRFAEALHELDIAQNLQPSSSAILTSRAFALGVSGHTEQAREMLRDLLSHDSFGKDPNSTTAHLVLGIVSAAEPRDWGTQFAQWRAIATLKNKKDAGDLLAFVNTLEPAYKRGGEAGLFKAALAYEKATHPNPADATMRMAQAEANLANFDDAFADLNRMADRHDTALVGVSLDPLLKPLHRDPRFAQLRTRLGLPKLTT